MQTHITHIIHLNPPLHLLYINRFYVASWTIGDHTNGDVWLYAEAPVGTLDQGPLALWTAKEPQGPFMFHSYVLEPSKVRTVRM